MWKLLYSKYDVDRQRITVWYCNCAGIVTEIGGQDWSYYGSTGTFYILHYDHLKNRMNGTRMIWRKEWIHPIVQNRPCAKNWITPKQQQQQGVLRGWHRRRIKTKEKAKVIAAVWGTYLNHFLAPLAIFYYDHLKYCKGRNAPGWF